MTYSEKLESINQSIIEIETSLKGQPPNDLMKVLLESLEKRRQDLIKTKYSQTIAFLSKIS